jgi:uncharacterized protein YyaL (SSP411 family)
LDTKKPRNKTLFFIAGIVYISAVLFILCLGGSREAEPADNKNMPNQNRLKNEKSPYLLQHADNPVDWYPWGEEAFEKAAREDKPILLSIGYSTCHWCHVMEHESFEDPEVAKMMNETFVSIKVDREERPDIDNVYMTVCQLLSKVGCGWPLNIIMTPDKKPFFAGTYIPKESRFGRIGMVELVPRIKEVWKDKREEVLKSADSITEAVKKATGLTEGSSGRDLTPAALTLGYNQLLGRFDETNGGFGTAPKFPTPHNLLFLLRYWKRTGDEQALSMVEATLGGMRKGGVYDHVGYGFHRYSTDPRWFLPHFEKMLYDQAMLALVFTEAYQATGKKEYEDTARQIFTYVMRDMASPEGGFYSAEDADSEGEEGKFYVWTEDEITGVLGKDDAELIIKTYNVGESGNFSEEASGEKTGSNILYLKKPLPELARSFGMSADEFEGRIDKSRKKLFDVREKRVHPHKDDKILTDWNGLMIAALSKGASAFSDPLYSDAAKRAADFLLGKMTDGKGRLLHRWRDGDAGIGGSIDDYSFFIWGLLELYESTFDIKYLKAALELQTEMTGLFWDDKNGGFYFTSHDAEELITRHKEIYDGAIPSGNSVAMLNLLRIGRITGDAAYDEMASKLAKAFSGTVEQAPVAYTQLLSSLDFAIGPSYEVVVVGDPASPDTKEMLSAIRKRYSPNKVLLFKGQGDVPGVTAIAEFTKGQSSIDGKATAYVCLDHVCNLPTTDLNKALELLAN